MCQGVFWYEVHELQNCFLFPPVYREKKSPETEMEFSGEVKLKRVVCHTDSCGLQESHMRSHLERQRPSGQGGNGLRQGQLGGAPTAAKSKRALCL